MANITIGANLRNSTLTLSGDGTYIGNGVIVFDFENNSTDVIYQVVNDMPSYSGGGMFGLSSINYNISFSNVVIQIPNDKDYIISTIESGISGTYETLPSGPKLFEEGDVLPLTTRLRISWTETFPYDFADHLYNNPVKTDSDNFNLAYSFSGREASSINGETITSFHTMEEPPYYWLSPYDTQQYIEIDTSAWSLSKRTVSTSTNTILYWEEIVGYSITYEENGGTTVTDLTGQIALPNPLPTPTKTGYTFLGWYYDSDFTNEAFADDPLTGDVTLYAKWELNTYTITYNSNGGSIVPQTSNATQLPTPLPIPTKSGYTFVNWYYDSAFTQKATAGDTLSANVTLYAKWHNLGSLFTEIADAIRSKDGTSDNIRDVDFGERVKQIQGAIELTQAQYDALGTKDANTYYLIVEE